MPQPLTQDLKAQLANPPLFEASRVRRDRYYNTVLIPALRLVGLLLIVVGVFFHLEFIDGVDPREPVRSLALLYVAYGFGSWAFLRAFYRRDRRLHLGDVFLVLDPFLWTVAIYLTGAEHSILFIILLARVADQTNTTFLRCIHFLNVAALSYLGLLLVLVVGGQEMNWYLQGSKLAILYLTGLYISLTALAAQRLRERAREAIRLAKETVDQLALQNTELVQAREAAEEVSRLKSGFLATMSHELRTPLNSVIGFCQLLEDPETGELNERQMRYLNNSLTSAKRLHALINDILDLSKIEAEGLELDLGPVDLKMALRQAVEVVRQGAERRGIVITEEHQPDLPLALGDSLRLRQICDNLLSNAVKYNVDGGQIAVSTWREGTRVVMSVRDTGPGIPLEKQRRVFDAFVQLDAGYQRRSEGTGLGLALCMSLCQLQQAELTLISPLSDRGGCAFEVRWRAFRRES